MRSTTTALTLALAFAAPAVAQHEMHGQGSINPAVTRAVAVLSPTVGNRVKGVVTFTQDSDRVKVVADVDGLTPGALHGFHIHELGDCSAPDAASAGGHFNPTGHPHAGPMEMARHGGDLGNLQADAAGRAHLELTVDGVTVHDGPTCILGRGLIVHLKGDDLKTQPTGNAGPRVACGVIGVAK
ncbi:MAG TPA: superoxide dismutase family protein [Thermoanaerobaculaceae bacterium]|nr:superoxide dismutase family protein [Thermoanaerobaculaceae bacterium]